MIENTTKLANAATARPGPWPRWFLPLVLVAVVLECLPAVFGGRHVDDWLQAEILAGDSEFARRESALTEFFTFANGDTAQTLRRIDRGVLPWWSDERLKMRFLRPISVLTHQLDQILWPEVEWLKHAHSVFWFLLAVVAAACVYREIGTTVVGACLATILFGIDDIHGITIGWVANRNHLVSGTLVLVAFRAHIQWQREGRSIWGLLSVALFAVALLSGESAVAYGAFVFAWAVTQHTGTVRHRIVSGLPGLLTGLIWLIVYRQFGFGASQSGQYVNPVGNPLDFLVVACERLPLFAAALCGTSSTELSAFADESQRQVLWWWACSSVAVIAMMMANGSCRDRCLQFWLLATFVSLLPLCAATPIDRVLLLPTFASHGVVARCLELGWSVLVRRRSATESVELLTPGWPARTLAWLFVILHLLTPSWLLPLRIAAFDKLGQRLESAATSRALARSLESRQLILVNPPDAFHGWHLPAVRRHHGLSNPDQVRVLASGLVPLQLDRVDDTTLVVRPKAPFLDRALSDLYRSKPLRVGWQRRLTGVDIEILEASPSGDPLAIQFRFDRRLESDDLVWMEWRDNQFVDLQLPSVGETLEIPARIESSWFSLGAMRAVLGVDP